VEDRGIFFLRKIPSKILLIIHRSGKTGKTKKGIFFSFFPPHNTRERKNEKNKKGEKKIPPYMVLCIAL